MPFTSIPVEPLDVAACVPYGVMLGKTPLDDASAPAYFSPSSDFWREHLFDNGAHGEAEILWVRYRNRDESLSALETHYLTQQAIVPLTGPIVQVVATSLADGSPDPASIRAFLVPVGQGLCMHRNTWHATRVMQDEVTALMLTRPSTTYDLMVHLRTGAPAGESGIRKMDGYRIG
ncbi:ureidoglycolate lyase [Paraburkholderia silviterrae]|uniref:Ureidoglycolate hydrolase n=1 Tax=Paraburkholderia silviterrae TaxID=2528715 RepID=A0A4R5LYX6_9BURK|nr:ureidoglycolate lyase [Paraburkholderia silviterrae]TDG17748.1 ureidoglycolate hydrolase [Paraburkholderia silviterrae]